MYIVTGQTAILPTYPTALTDVEPLIGKAHNGVVTQSGGDFAATASTQFDLGDSGSTNLGTGTYTMTGGTIMISVPTINIARLEEVPGLIGDPQEVVAAVLMHMLGDLTGRTLLLFPDPVARQVCDMLLKRPLGS